MRYSASVNLSAVGLATAGRGLQGLIKKTLILSGISNDGVKGLIKTPPSTQETCMLALGSRLHNIFLSSWVLLSLPVSGLIGLFNVRINVMSMRVGVEAGGN